MSSSMTMFSKLFALASSQDGYFTAQQALDAGYSRQSQSYHVQNGDWAREWRGIYRLADYRVPEYPHLMLLYLWTSDQHGVPQGVISHDMALDLYNLGTWTRGKATITVPPGFRRNAPPPGGWKSMCLYHGNLRPQDIMLVHKVPFTTPIKTIVDLLVAGHVPRHHLCDAMEDALHGSLVSDEQMIDADLSPQERAQLVQLLKDIGYVGRQEEIQIGQRLQASA